jgi:diacylglycerol kinase family enzyme
MFMRRPLLHSARLSGRKVKIESLGGGGVPMHVDGEFAGNCPALIEIRKGALKVLVP